MQSVSDLAISAAFTGEACLGCCTILVSCSSDKSGGARLHFTTAPPTITNGILCHGCQSARYCSPACQRTDWIKHHRLECHLLRNFREEYPRIDLEDYMDDDDDDDAEGESIPEKLDSNKARSVVILKGRVFMALRCSDNKRFGAFTILSKLCAICAKSEYECNNEAPNKWVNCTTCHFGWCCCQEHFEKYYRDTHSQDNICSRFVRISEVERFRWQHFKNHGKAFTFLPQSASFQPPFATFPGDWKALFHLRCGDQSLDRLPSEFLPAATLELSQPYTCLYAMYQHKGSLQRFFDNNTSVSETLTIHILGACPTYELPFSAIWEELMHCLPSVQTLNPVFVGPEATQRMLPFANRIKIPAGGMECCPSCQAQGRKWVVGMHEATYHQFCRVQTKYNRYTPPNLVVAFNTGIAQEETESWKPTLKLILDLNVPAMFTSFNRQEASEDYEVLLSLGAKLLTSEPTLNPVRVDMDFIDPSGTTAPFFQPNMYCICFHGRRLD